MHDPYQNLDNNYFKSVYFNTFVVHFRSIKERRSCVLFGKKDKIKDIKNPEHVLLLCSYCIRI